MGFLIYTLLETHTSHDFLQAFYSAFPPSRGKAYYRSYWRLHLQANAQ
jgi:hypothetical protein